MRDDRRERRRVISKGRRLALILAGRHVEKKLLQTADAWGGFHILTADPKAQGFNAFQTVCGS